jgi:hypothetical protein
MNFSSAVSLGKTIGVRASCGIKNDAATRVESRVIIRDGLFILSARVKYEYTFATRGMGD